jgi:hypothetical protein
MSFVILVGSDTHIVSDVKAYVVYANPDQGRAPKLFDTPESAGAWWNEKIPSYPKLGTGGIRCEPYEAHADWAERIRTHLEAEARVSA